MTTVTVHLSFVVAPPAPGPWPLHWSIAMVADWAAVGWTTAAENPPASSVRAMASPIVRHVCRAAGIAAGIVPVLMWLPCEGRCEPYRNRARVERMERMEHTVAGRRHPANSAHPSRNPAA